MNIPQAIREMIPDEESPTIISRINEFKEFVLNDSNTIDTIVDKYLLFGTPYIFSDDENLYYELKADIAKFLEIQQTQIYIVGSAKLGFSIAPQKRYSFFDEESDVDVAVIDGDLFVRYWKELFESTDRVKACSQSEADRRRKFQDYFFRGWLRPDQFPMKQREKWFDFFSSLNKKYNRKIAAGIYRDFDFFMSYHRSNIEEIRRELRNGI